MKRFFAVVIVYLATVLVIQAQVKPVSSDHLTFKGVPITGPLEEFVLKMKAAGFTHLRTEDGVTILKGDFASYKDCIVGVSTLKDKNLVNKLAVFFPNRDTWSSLSTNYFSLKEMLTEKYGTPIEVEEKFQSYTPEDDGSKLVKVKLGSCKYRSIYETSKGTIQLSIDHDRARDCFVKLAYFDKINGDIIKAKAKGDL